MEGLVRALHVIKHCDTRFDIERSLDCPCIICDVIGSAEKSSISNEFIIIVLSYTDDIM